MLNNIMNMKYTIYIIRHQKPGQHVNCISKQELNNTKSMYEKIKTLQIGRVFTRYPTTQNNHIRPLQTASNLCTFMGQNIELCNEVKDLPNYITTNVLVVWNHSDIKYILEKYNMSGWFEWPENDYDGCLMINEYGWEYDHSFFK